MERFQNKRYLINKHVSAIFKLNKSDKESASYLRQLLDDLQKHLRALHALGQPTDQWDTLIIHIITNSLDTNTHREWESELKSDEVPALSDLIKFLQKRCQVLEAVGTKPSQWPRHPPLHTEKFQSRQKLTIKSNTFSSTQVVSCLLYTSRCV